MSLQVYWSNFIASYAIVQIASFYIFFIFFNKIEKDQFLY